MTPQIALTLAVLGAAVLLFALEVFRVDVVAVVVLLALAWLRLVTPQEAFAGLASNAVVAVVGVMILGHGLTRTGVVGALVRPLERAAGTGERRLTATMSVAVGTISAFMQNVGAAALFLPVLVRLAHRRAVPLSRLLMPVAFAAILGGTLTMVGSSPLIILNDLLRQGGVEPYGLFSVTPLGVLLLGTGCAYFALFGRWLLPAVDGHAGADDQQALVAAWSLPEMIHACRVPAASPLIGSTRENSGLDKDYDLHLLAVWEDGDLQPAPWRHTRFAAGQQLALTGTPEDVVRFRADFGLEELAGASAFAPLRASTGAAFAELVVPPRSRLVGSSLRQIAFRRRFGVEPIVLYSGGHQRRGDFSDLPLEAGCTLVVHGLVERLRQLTASHDLVLVTRVGAVAPDRSKAAAAVLCFVAAVGLALAGAPLALALFTGATAMVLLRVTPPDEAYQAVDWRTVFLLAGLIPLGTAMDKSGAANYVASGVLSLLPGSHVLLLLIGVAALSTGFSLFMSNVAATVLLVPLAMGIGARAGVDPRALALLVAVCASNSFVLPTHQVNALYMAPGGYRTRDFVRAGGFMTVAYIGVATLYVYLFHL